MESYLLILSLIITSEFCFGQANPNEYPDLIKKAESFYKSKDYKASAAAYSDAFKSLGWKGQGDDRYNAACSWALAGIPDSAFFNLDRIVSKLNFTDYDQLSSDSDLISLHNDSRWTTIIDRVKTNKEKAEANLNRPLAKELDSILTEDQRYRNLMGEYAEKYGRNSNESHELWRKTNEIDSLNLIRVEEILDKYGWLGPDIVGDKGVSALFIVIQHSDLKTQEKYLPSMKQAVKDGKARAIDLALLIDRVEMGNGRPQIYGSQIRLEDGRPTIYKILDEPNVNKRRTEIGLEPLELYAKNWDIDYKLPSK